jgi:hypothetical protein
MELVLATADTLYLVDPLTGHDLGSVAHACGDKPISVHDFDGDGLDELAVPSCDNQNRAIIYGLDATGTNLAPRSKSGGSAPPNSWAAVASFDLLGAGHAELLYADTLTFALYAGETGSVILERARTANPAVGSPVVADVDNDGHADLLVPTYEADGRAWLSVISDGSWVGARRIWNQYAYHVTNVHEDARIPAGPADAPDVPMRMRSNLQQKYNRFCLPSAKP